MMRENSYPTQPLELPEMVTESGFEKKGSESTLNINELGYIEAIESLQDKNEQWDIMLYDFGMDLDYRDQVEHESHMTPEQIQNHEQGVKNRLRLIHEGKFKDLAQVYFSALKQHFPSYEKLIDASAEVLHDKKPFSPETKNVIVSSAYVGEAGIVRFIEQLRKQNLKDNQTEVVIFLNGKENELNKEKLLQRQAEIDDYFNNIEDNDDFVNRIKIVSGLFSTFGKKYDNGKDVTPYGQFKATASLIAAKAVQKAGIDGDIGLQTLDADIVTMDEAFIQKVTTNMERGNLFGQGVLDVDPALTGKNSTFFIANKLLSSLEQHILVNKSFGKKYAAVGMPGGNSFMKFSAFLGVGGYKPHKLSGEDTDLKTELLGLSSALYSEEFEIQQDAPDSEYLVAKQERYASGAIFNTENSKVYFDGERENITFANGFVQANKFLSENYHTTSDFILPDSEEIDLPRVLFELVNGFRAKSINDFELSGTGDAAESIMKEAGINGISAQELQTLITVMNKHDRLAKNEFDKEKNLYQLFASLLTAENMPTDFDSQTKGRFEQSLTAMFQKRYDESRKLTVELPAEFYRRRELYQTEVAAGDICRARNITGQARQRVFADCVKELKNRQDTMPENIQKLDSNVLLTIVEACINREVTPSEQ